MTAAAACPITMPCVFGAPVRDGIKGGGIVRLNTGDAGIDTFLVAEVGETGIWF